MCKRLRKVISVLENFDLKASRLVCRSSLVLFDNIFNHVVSEILTTEGIASTDVDRKRRNVDGGGRVFVDDTEVGRICRLAIVPEYFVGVGVGYCRSLQWNEKRDSPDNWDGKRTGYIMIACVTFIQGKPQTKLRD